MQRLPFTLALLNKGRLEKLDVKYQTSIAPEFRPKQKIPWIQQNCEKIFFSTWPSGGTLDQKIYTSMQTISTEFGGCCNWRCCPKFGKWFRTIVHESSPETCNIEIRIIISKMFKAIPSARKKEDGENCTSPRNFAKWASCETLKQELYFAFRENAPVAFVFGLLKYEIFVKIPPNCPLLPLNSPAAAFPCYQKFCHKKYWKIKLWLAESVQKLKDKILNAAKIWRLSHNIFWQSIFSLNKQSTKCWSQENPTLYSCIVSLWETISWWLTIKPHLFENS